MRGVGTEAAQDTLGGAVAAAAEIAGQRGVDLLDAARDAFDRAFVAVSITSAVVLIAAALLAAVLLRRVDDATGHP